MSWLASLVRGLFEALLPFLFNRGPTRAEDSTQAPADIRLSWAARIQRRMHELESKSSTGSSDSERGGASDGSD